MSEVLREVRVSGLDFDVALDGWHHDVYGAAVDTGYLEMSNFVINSGLPPSLIVAGRVDLAALGVLEGPGRHGGGAAQSRRADRQVCASPLRPLA